MHDPNRNDREYECAVSFTYNALGPADAGQQFVDNLAMHPGWDIDVRDVETGERWLVDAESGEAEEQRRVPQHYVDAVIRQVVREDNPEADARLDLLGRRYVDPHDSGQLVMKVIGLDAFSSGYVIVAPYLIESDADRRIWRRAASAIRPLCILHAMTEVVRDFMADAMDREEHLDDEREWLNDYAAVAAAVDLAECWAAGSKMHWDELESGEGEEE